MAFAGVHQQLRKVQGGHLVKRTVLGSPFGPNVGFEEHSPRTRRRPSLQPANIVIGANQRSYTLPMHFVPPPVTAGLEGIAVMLGALAGRMTPPQHHHAFAFAQGGEKAFVSASFQDIELYASRSAPGVRIDWGEGGAFSVFVLANGPGCEHAVPPALADGASSGAGRAGTDGRRRAAATRRALLRKLRKVPGLDIREFLPALVASTALLGFAQSASALEVQALDETAEAAVILSNPGFITQPVAAALILPLVLYRVAATAAGEQLRPATDFAIIAAVCSFIVRFYIM